MPNFCTESEINIDPQEFVDECSESEKDELREALEMDGFYSEQDIYEYVAMMFFRNELDLKKLINKIGRDQFTKALYE